MATENKMLVRQRKATETWNKLLSGRDPKKSCNASTFQNQILKAVPTGTTHVNGPRETEMLALALGILEGDGRFPRYMLEAFRLRMTKGKDYNNVGGGRDAYFPFGMESYVHEIHKKALRLVSLTVVDGERPVHEPVEDTVLDMINYACYLAEWMEKQQ